MTDEHRQRQHGMHLAQLNIGRLVESVDHPRLADFIGNLDRVNGLGKRMPGFVWMMEGSGEPGTGNTENSIGGDPQFVTNLTVWKDVESLERFVWGTIHKQFYDRRRDWFEVLSERHFVMWWVPEGHRPTQDEALARLEHLKVHGESDHAFGWGWLKAARMWQTHACEVAAE